MANSQSHNNEWAELRRNMIDRHIRPRGVQDERVLAAIRRTPREIFVPESLRASAYEDRALPVGHGQTISQPYIVAYMTEQLAPTEGCRVLEIGTGTGYQTALLAALCKEVFTVERIEALQREATARLTSLGVTNVHPSIGDGSVGLPEFAPYDRILVTAAAPRVPAKLVSQLADDGRLVIPVGGRHEQTIVRVVRLGSRHVETPLLACRFVKLIGQDAWTTA